ncbi:hypothetical protein BJ944DRAFT_276170 [Cunninghamella echinulata]|nr:hypothetical protein BJ944DRAFT_276170 [Cunninghamella echinulata]
MTTKPLHSDINDGTPMTVPVSNISPMTSFYIPFLSYKNCQDKNDEISEGSSDNSTWLKKQSSGDMDYYIGNSEEEDYDDNENKKEDDGEAEISDKNKGDEYEGVNNAVNNEKKDNKKKVNNSERSYRHKPRLASSPYPTTVTQNDQHNNITKPRWSNKERSKLLLAVIKEKQLDKLSTFRWKVISKHLNSKRSINKKVVKDPGKTRFYTYFTR